MIAAGGACGGVFVALAAPHLFTTYYELHIGFLACALLLLVVLYQDRNGVLYQGRPRWAWVLMVMAVGGLGGGLYVSMSEEVDLIVARSRSFYGVLTVLEYDPDDPYWHRRLLQHGGTTHGLQFRDPSRRRIGTSYYGPNSGVGLVMRHLPPRTNRRIGVVGLGSGSLIVYGQPGDYIRIYEIDPEVEGVARKWFTYLEETEAGTEIALGDARLSLEREPPQQFDVLVLDAFSSDSIPVHLLTREAFEIYRRHVKPDGAIAVHTSNRFLDLNPVVQRIAEHFAYQLVYVDGDEDEESAVYNTDWCVLTNNRQFIENEEVVELTSELEPPSPRVRLWTDEESNLFRIVMF
jgi:hypothetical protein